LPIPIQIFDLQVPSLLKPNQAMEQTAILTHHTLAFVLAALVLAHVGAALFHHFVLKDKMLARMIRNQRD
jgi:cytochrome b561